MRKVFLLGTFLLCSSLWYSCAISDDVVLQPNLKYDKVKQEEVVLYLSSQDLPENYEKVGLVFKGYVGFAMPSKQIKKARIDAAKMGANGLYWENFNSNNRSYSITGDTIVIGQQQNNDYFIAIRTR